MQYAGCALWLADIIPSLCYNSHNLWWMSWWCLMRLLLQACWHNSEGGRMHAHLLCSMVCCTNCCCCCVFDLENLGQGHQVLHSQWCHSVANTNRLSKPRDAFLCYSSHRFRDIKVWNVWHWKFRSGSWSTTFKVMSFDEANIHRL